MIKITNEIDGKLYELAPEKDWRIPCKGCAFTTHNGDGLCLLKDDCFNGCCVCSELRGIWKEVQNVNTKYEVLVKLDYDGMWIYQGGIFPDIESAKSYVKSFKGKFRFFKRVVTDWKEVKDDKAI